MLDCGIGLGPREFLEREEKERERERESGMSRYEGSGFRGKAKDKMFGLVCIRCLAWSEHRSSGHEKFRYLSSVSQVSQVSLSLSPPPYIYIYV